MKNRRRCSKRILSVCSRAEQSAGEGEAVSERAQVETQAICRAIRTTVLKEQPNKPTLLVWTVQSQSRRTLDPCVTNPRRVGMCAFV